MMQKKYLIVFILFLWVSITGLIQSFKCVSMTQIEVLINIPKSSVLIWKECK
jgi:hypothetical protein